MRSAREIACTDKMGDCGAWRGPRSNHHSTECDARTEAIQQAREDGARWALEQVEAVIRNLEDGEFVYPGTIADGIEPEDVRKVAP